MSLPKAGLLEFNDLLLVKDEKERSPDAFRRPDNRLVCWGSDLTL
jgi:hypothetical protein